MVLLDTGTRCISGDIYSKDADDGTQTCNTSVVNRAIELNRSKAIAGKELGLSSWYNASLYIYHSQLWLTSHPRSKVALLDTGTPGTGEEIYSEDADGETRTRNPSVINRVL